MLFTGHSLNSIDAKARLSIPAKYRSQWSDERDGKAWYCVPWPGRILRLYTETAFTAMAESIEQSLMPAEDQADLDADLFSLAERLEMDAQGRVALPAPHLELTGLSGEVVVIGPATVSRSATAPNGSSHRPIVSRGCPRSSREQEHVATTRKPPASPSGACGIDNPNHSFEHLIGTRRTDSPLHGAHRIAPAQGSRRTPSARPPGACPSPDLTHGRTTTSRALPPPGAPGQPPPPPVPPGTPKSNRPPAMGGRCS